MAKSALLVMDVQQSIVDNMKNPDEYLSRVKSAVVTAHENGVLVIYIVVRFRKGYPEVSPNNMMFNAIRERFTSISMDVDGPATRPVITPKEGDLVIAKKRVSAFAGSDLEMVLGAQRIDELVLCGIATSGVVLSTLRYAADKDFKITVLSDCCSDQDEEVHRVLTEKLFHRQAAVMTAEEWGGGLK